MKVQGIVTALIVALKPVTLGEAVKGGGTAALEYSGARKPEILRVDIARLGVLSWLFIFLATTGAGAYILVFSGANAGFGTPLDYLLCLLWGLGLPAGAQLMNATTSTISSTFTAGK